VHLTSGLGIPTGDPAELEGLTDAERAGVAELAALFAGGSGYGPYLANRPQTLAYGLHDSPVAQLAYLVERFKEFDGWDTAARLEDYLDRDQLLTNASLYWFTGTAGSSSWTYYEGAAGLPVDQTLVPTGVSHGPPGIRRLAERKNHIVHWAEHDSPSHMVAMAVPEVLVGDLREFFGPLR
jgi:epoxide hydrolase